MKMIKCSRCEFFHKEYEHDLCPRHGIMARMFGFNENDIDDCIAFEWVKDSKSNWSKKQIIEVARYGGATNETIMHIQKIPLNDLKLILLKPLGMEPRGRYKEIWQKTPDEWEQVRRTMMYGLNWDLIEVWNQSLRDKHEKK